MGQIQVLSESVINQIAAGEVVERPASVVKELVENALDAGATQITLTLKNGGRDFISVLDNGRGMDAEDARLSVQRHATSKLKDAAGLERIETLGFRGEALASIAAVARFELVTCADEAAGGLRLVLEGGRETESGRVGFARGTRVTVQDLFFGVPARRKFLRAAATEFQHVQGLLTPITLAHPRVQFRLLHNGKPVFNLGRCEGLAERVYQVLGADLRAGMVPVEGAEGLLRFSGLLSLPNHAQSSRRWQYLILNGRAIRNAGLNHGVYQAYRTLLMKDRHPAYVLLLELDPREVDVNVHPSKLEVRLRNAPWMHAVLADRLHKGLLDASRRLAFGARESAPSGNPPRAAGPAPWGQLELPAAVSDVRTAAAPAAASGPERPGLNPPAPAALRAQPAGAADLIGNPYGGGGFHFQPLSGRTGGGAAGEAAARDGAPAAAPGGALAGGMTALGQLHRTYILAQRADALLVIDQHAAHERILFEQYRGQFYRGKLVTERYLIPLTLDLSAQNGLLLEQYLPQWRRLGFEIEAFGRDSYAVRQIPGLLAGKDIGRLILEVLDELALFGKSGRMEEAINEILERVACHAAIRGGQTLSREEMDALLAQVEGLDINLYCPHGRPVWVEVGQRELEKRFKRLV